MPLSTDWIVITDGRSQPLFPGIPQGLGSKQTIEFDIPDETALSARPLLAFVFNVAAGSENLSFTVNINGSDELSYTFTGYIFTSVHEVITANILRHRSPEDKEKKRKANNITFTATSGTGALTFSDVVLFVSAPI